MKIVRFLALCLCLFAVVRAPAAETVIISEFVADNGRPGIDQIIVDEDGDNSDWIEIFNAGNETVDLQNWILTDSATGGSRWRFPATNLNARSYLIVWASGKNRIIPGLPLHTSFGLSRDGEYLALLKPDGSVANEFRPTYGRQMRNVSYGIASVSEPVNHVASNSMGKAFFPGNEDLGDLWHAIGFNDSSWTSVGNGVGFEGTPTGTSLAGAFQTDIGGQMAGKSSVYLRYPFVLEDASAVEVLSLSMKYDDGFLAYLNGQLVARRNDVAPVRIANSSLEFSGVQGASNWFYGYYVRGTDADQHYHASEFVEFARSSGSHSLSNMWTGSIWDWFPAGVAPWTELNSTGGHPNGSNNGTNQWAIRRYQSEASGTLSLGITLRKSNLGCGNGITGRVFHNGTEVFARTIAFGDGTGITTNIVVSDVNAGDAIDFVIDPLGTDGTDNDGCDSTIFTATIDFIPDPAPEFDSVAVSSRPDNTSLVAEEFDLSRFRDFLLTGTNVLTIQGLNASGTDNDFLIAPQLSSRTRQLDVTQLRYFVQPTPGALNRYGQASLGAFVTATSHTPQQPRDDEDILVRATLLATGNPVTSVSLVYRVMYSNEVTVPMYDDGQNWDNASGDNTFGGRIPASASRPGQMVRWYILAQDSAGVTSRWPLYQDPLNSPQYLGTVIHNSALTNPLPVLHWFMQNPTSAESDAGTRGSLYFLGRFYDNVYQNLHGQSSRGFPKKSFDIDFNPGDHFTWKEGEEPVDDINLLTTYPDKAKVRNMLGYGTYEAAGHPSHFVEPVRVELNGAFHGDWHIVENGDENYLRRVGLDPRGALYKVYNSLETATAVEKKSRKFDGNADVTTLVNNAINMPAAERLRWFYDNVDVPGIVNYTAAGILTGNVDCCHKNYYIYRDSEGNGEWTFLPWDVDLSFGRNWNSAQTYWDERLYPNNGLNVGSGNRVLAVLFGDPNFLAMYHRRIRTLIDELLKTSNTPMEERFYEGLMNYWQPLISPDAALDLAKWGTWGNGAATSLCCVQSVPDAIREIIEVYLPARRTYLTGLAQIPASQPSSATVVFGNVDISPVSGNQDQEYIEIRNPNAFAMDISGWKIAGGVQHTFKPGTVIPANGSLFLSPNVVAFRARQIGPGGNQGRLVQGDYSGRLSARGETLKLLRGDQEMQIINIPGTPSAAQNSLRITEIMFNPWYAGEAGFTGEDFEFIELANFGTNSLSLAGVRFIEGIQFDFTGSGVQSLAPAQSVVVVRNLAAYQLRYGNTNRVAGAYAGSLDNSGETLQLVDSLGEKILEFSYNNSWYPITEGLGFSLVVVDDQTPWDLWGRRANWRPGSVFKGTPGAVEPPSIPLPAVYVNEVLSHTDLPDVDAIELYNPTSNSVDVSGWFISDDFLSPKKFIIPSGTTIPAGGYLVFTEADFNSAPGTGTSFAFSSTGDEVFLYSGNGTDLTGYLHGFRFRAAENDVSFGRYITSVGEEHFVAQRTQTLGSANSGPKIGPVIITEIMYNPAPKDTNDTVMFEYVEILNVSTQQVRFVDETGGPNPWMATNGIEFSFPANGSLDAGEYALLIPFNPTNTVDVNAFKAFYGITDNVKLFGPFNNRLSNEEDRIELWHPDIVVAGHAPFYLVDGVHYLNIPPWPSAADGIGAALQRLDLNDYANDPANWTGASPTPGQARPSGAPPQITTQPENVTLVGNRGNIATFSVEASGAGPFNYQWRLNGRVIPGATNSTYVIPNIMLTNQGSYSVVVFNPTGSADSRSALLTVDTPVELIMEPRSFAGRTGTNVTLTALASGPRPFTYQWLVDGAEIQGATNASLAVTNIQVVNGIYTKNYQVLVEDAISSDLSSNAVVMVLVNPAVLVPLVGITNNPGDTISFTLVLTGTPPFTISWRKNSAELPGQTNMTLVITNAQASDTGSYQVRVQNPVGPPGIQTPAVSVVVQSPPTITSNPPSVLNRAGAGISLRGSAVGGPVPAYQWFFNGAPMAGRTTIPLTIVLSTNTEGVYNLRASNVFGMAMSKPAFVQIDTDLDGVPDRFERQIGSDPDVRDSDADADSDGFSNLGEYVAGTDPSDSNSYLKLEAGAQAGSADISFNAVSNRTYTIEFRNSFDTNWERLLDFDDAETNRVLRLNDTNNASPFRFYRLITPRLP